MKYNFEDFTLFNEKMRGLLCNEMVVIAGARGACATMMGVNIAKRAFLRSTPIPTLIFSPKRSAKLLYNDMIRSMSIEAHLLPDGPIPQQFSSSVKDFDNAPFWIDDTYRIPISKIQTTAYKLNHQLDGKLGFIIIYDFQDILAPAFLVPREDEVLEASRAIKEMAKELRVPMLVFVELNCQYQHEKRPPRVSDMRNCALIERDADAILFLDDIGRRNEDGACNVNVNISKNKKGSTGLFSLLFDRDGTHFSNHSKSGSSI